jgi:hypothetical protein
MLDCLFGYWFCNVFILIFWRNTSLKTLSLLLDYLTCLLNVFLHSFICLFDLPLLVTQKCKLYFVRHLNLHTWSLYFDILKCFFHLFLHAYLDFIIVSLVSTFFRVSLSFIIGYSYMFFFWTLLLVTSTCADYKLIFNAIFISFNMLTWPILDIIMG